MNRNATRSLGPYRDAGTLGAPPRPTRLMGDETESFPLSFAVWIGSVARTVFGAAHHERIGTELGLALVLVAVLPWTFPMRRRYRSNGR